MRLNFENRLRVKSLYHTHITSNLPETDSHNSANMQQIKTLSQSEKKTKNKRKFSKSYHRKKSDEFG